MFKIIENVKKNHFHADKANNIFKSSLNNLDKFSNQNTSDD